MAQLVARFHGMEEARGSNPLSSTENPVQPPAGRDFTLSARTVEESPIATPHIAAEPGQIAPLVLMPGDP